MAEISWTRESQRWLKEIHDYISRDNPSAARRVAEDIYQRVQILKRWPEVGYKYERYPEFNIRILLFGHYRIAYLIKPDGNIDILGIFHDAMDINKYLF